jgi:hypothetical protein
VIAYEGLIIYDGLITKLISGLYILLSYLAKPSSLALAMSISTVTIFTLLL